MAETSFIRASEAASIADITVEDIGVAANNFVRKKELVATGRFLGTPLEKYGDTSFIKTADVQRGAVTITVSVDASVTSRATVQIGDGEASSTATADGYIGNNITVKCNVKSGDVFAGWYSGSDLVSSDASYTFEVSAAVSLVAKVNYLDVSPASLSYENSASEKTFNITSNVNWELS